MEKAYSCCHRYIMYSCILGTLCSPVAVVLFIRVWVGYCITFPNLCIIDELFTVLEQAILIFKTGIIYLKHKIMVFKQPIILFIQQLTDEQRMIFKQQIVAHKNLVKDH